MEFINYNFLKTLQTERISSHKTPIISTFTLSLTKNIITGTAMEISEKLLKFKFHILIAATLAFIIVSLLYVAPRFLNILAYFWPLFLSTALFLVAVVVFSLTSPPSAQVSGEKAGEGILDYVAGRPEPVLQPESEEGSSSSSKSEKM